MRRNNIFGATIAIMGVMSIASTGVANAYDLSLNGRPVDVDIVLGGNFPDQPTAPDADANGNIDWAAVNAPAVDIATGFIGAGSNQQDFEFRLGLAVGEELTTTESTDTADPPVTTNNATTYKLVLSLDGAMFAAGGLSSLSVLGADLTSLATQTASGSEVEIDLVIEPGADGAAASVNELYLVLPLSINSCSKHVSASILSLDIHATTDNGGTLVRGAKQNANAISADVTRCVYAYDISFVSDVDVGGGNSVLDSTAAEGTFSRIKAGAAGVNETADNLDTKITATIGAVSMTFNPNNVADVTDVAFDLSDNVDTNKFQVPTTINAASELAKILPDGISVEFAISSDSVEAVANWVDDFNVLGTGISPANTALSTASVSVNDVVRDSFIYDRAQSKLLSPIKVTIMAQDGIVPQGNISAAFTAVNIGMHQVSTEVISLDALDLGDGYCGEFDWVSDGSDDWFNVFRITGHGMNAANVTITAMLDNVSGTASSEMANLVDPIVSNSEILVNTNHLTSAFGSFGTADVSFMLDGAQGTLDCDRLYSAGGVMAKTPFGNNRTIVAGADGDD